MTVPTQYDPNAGASALVTAINEARDAARRAEAAAIAAQDVSKTVSSQSADLAIARLMREVQSIQSATAEARQSAADAEAAAQEVVSLGGISWPAVAVLAALAVALVGVGAGLRAWAMPAIWSSWSTCSEPPILTDNGSTWCKL